MSLDEVTRDELLANVAQLKEALFNHQVWHGALVRTLACGLPGDKHDTSESAHTECRFGQWYYSDAPAKLRNHPGFIAIGEEHQRMHRLAKLLLIAAHAGNAHSPARLRQLLQCARAAAARDEFAGAGAGELALQPRLADRRHHPLRHIADLARAAGAGEAPRPGLLHRHDGPGQLQGHQRSPRARRGRSGAGGVGALPDQAPPPLRQGVPLRRRGVPAVPAVHAADARPGPDQGALRRPRRDWRWTSARRRRSGSPRPSGWRSSIRICRCAPPSIAPTRRCMRPRPRGGIACGSGTPPCSRVPRAESASLAAVVRTPKTSWRHSFGPKVTCQPR